MMDLNVLSRPSLMLDAVNDGRHALRNEPKARESVPYLLNLPEHGISLFTYTWVNHAGEAGAVMAIFGPGVGATPIVEHLADRPVPAEMNFNDWRLGPLHIQHDLQFDHAQLSWQGSAAQLDLHFEAMHPPYAYGRDERGCMGYVADERIEQSGRAKGRLTLGGRVIDFDCTGHRDHSWGTRDWQVFQHYKWVHAQAGADVALHFWLVEAMGRTEVRGYVFKAGHMALVTTVDFQFQWTGALDVQHYQAQIHDESGRTTTLEVAVSARFHLYPEPSCCLYEQTGSALIDGQAGVSWLEMFWPESYRQHMAAVGPY